MKASHSSDIHVALNLAKWEGRRSLFNFNNYVAMFLSLCVAWFMLNGTISEIKQDGLLVEVNPFLIPFLLILLPYAVFLALAVAVSVTREIESRTMEVLFLTPINYFTFVVGRFLGQMTHYMIALSLVSIFFLGYSASVNLRFTSGLLGAMLLSPFTVMSVVGFGILVASFLRKTGLTLIVLLVVILILFAIQFGQAVLPNIQPEEASSTLFVLSDALSGIYRVVEWISPFAYLAKGVDAAQVGAPQLYGLVLLISLLYTVLTLASSIWLLQRKGFS